jgi:hypothetical protein
MMVMIEGMDECFKHHENIWDISASNISPGTPPNPF